MDLTLGAKVNPTSAATSLCRLAAPTLLFVGTTASYARTCAACAQLDPPGPPIAEGALYARPIVGWVSALCPDHVWDDNGTPAGP